MALPRVEGNQMNKSNQILELCKHLVPASKKRKLIKLILKFLRGETK